MTLDSIAITALTAHLQSAFPAAMAVYAFGSRLSGHATADSDLDMAILVEGYANTIRLYEVAGDLSEIAGCPVDLLDFRAASTVMQWQILTNGSRLWARTAVEADTYEAAVLSDKLELDVSRGPLLADIMERGSVYGR